MNHIGPNELIVYTDEKGGIYSGGFSLNNILKNIGESPIITLNNNTRGGGEQVSDLFKDLAIPIHALYYKTGGSENYSNYHNETSATSNDNSDNDNSDNSDNEDDIDSDTDNVDGQKGGNFISDDLYNKLLGLVSVDVNGNEIQEHKQKKQSKRLLKNKNKKTRKHKKQK
jgi:hypothetical protein